MHTFPKNRPEPHNKQGQDTALRRDVADAVGSMLLDLAVLVGDRDSEARGRALRRQSRLGIPTVADIGEGTRSLAHLLQLEIIEKDPRYPACCQHAREHGNQ